MTMENFPLNKAHQQERRAEALLKQKKFEEAIECHRNAMELLSDACKTTENQRSVESLRLQHDYHKKQINNVQIKREQLEHYKKTLWEKQNRKNSDSSSEVSNEPAGEGSLQAVINRTIEVHDSLIDYFVRRGTGSDNDSLKSYSTSDTEEKVDREAATPIVGNKHPKDDSQIIEELKLLKTLLRDSVQFLLGQLDDRNKEIEELKYKIKALEYEKKAHTKNNSSLRVVTDSSGGTSPYVFSPCSELSPDVVETRPLPSLEPLEMPNFDFLNLIKSNSTNNNID